jgi:hypothetical protein
MELTPDHRHQRFSFMGKQMFKYGAEDYKIECAKVRRKAIAALALGAMWRFPERKRPLFAGDIKQIIFELDSNDPRFWQHFGKLHRGRAHSAAEVNGAFRRRCSRTLARTMASMRSIGCGLVACDRHSPRSLEGL